MPADHSASPSLYFSVEKLPVGRYEIDGVDQHRRKRP